MTQEQLPDRAETFAQISFVPYLLPGPIEPEYLAEVAARIAEETGSSQVVQTHTDRALIGPEHTQLCTEVDLISLRIYLLSFGIGVIRIDWPIAPIPDDPRELLKIRRERHKEIIDGSSDVGAKAHSFATRSGEAYQLFCHNLLALPSNTSCPFDYIFSMYELCFANDQQSDLLRITEAALLEPSRLGVSDTSWQSTSQLQANLRVLKPPTEYTDSEIDSLSQCRMSWASVVVSGTISQDHRELYSALEVRTQALWLLAHRISKVRPGVQGMNLPQLGMLANLFERTVLASLTLDDPTVNERILRRGRIGVVPTLNLL